MNSTYIHIHIVIENKTYLLTNCHKNPIAHLIKSTMAPSAMAQQGSWVLNRATNDGQVGNDIIVIRSYVRDKLFEKAVVVWTKSALVKNGVFYKDYVKNCKSLVADGCLMTASNDKAEANMNMLWERWKNRTPNGWERNAAQHVKRCRTDS